jgi:MFS family permease
MAAVSSPADLSAPAGQPPGLSRGTLVAATLAVCVAQIGLAIPAVLNGLFQQDLGPTSAQLTWISAAFLVPITLLELTFGVLGDLFGRKRLLIIGSLLLALGEAVAVLTPGAGTSTDLRVVVLWAGQILAGLGAAAIFPTTLAMVAAGAHTAHARSRALPIWAAALASGGFLSPVLGGWFARYGWGGAALGGWRWAFVLVAVLAVVSTIVTARWARTSSSPQGRSLDWPGQMTIAVSLFALLFAVIQGPTSGWGSTPVIVGFVVFAVFFALFVAVELRAEKPLLRLDLFTNRAFAVSSAITVLSMFSLLGVGYATSIRLAAIQGFTPLKTSIAFVLLNVMALLLVPLASRLLDRTTPRVILTIGCTLLAAGSFWISSLSAATISIGPLVVPLLLIGTGFALALNGVTSVAVNSVPPRLAGMASGTTSLLRDFGFTLGPAVIGAVALSRAASEISAKVSGDPKLSTALEHFTASAQSAPPAQRGAAQAAVDAVQSGPLGANAVPSSILLPNGQTAPLNPLKDVAFAALDHGYSTGYLVTGLAALVAALLAAFVLRTAKTEVVP